MSLHSFTVKRSEWLHGEGSQKSRLFRKYDGKRCCVGFFANSIGIDDVSLVEMRTFEGLCGLTPSPKTTITSLRVEKLIEQYPFLMRMKHSLQNIYETNDDTHLSDAEREEQLITVFRDRFHIDVTFVD